MSELHLSRLTLRRDAKAVAPLIAVLNPDQPGARISIDHRLLWTVMPSAEADGIAADPDGTAPRFLWRRDGDLSRYFVLGPKPADGSPFFDIETRPFAPDLSAGDRLAFQLRVNATVNRKVGTGPDGRALRRRCDVTMDLIRSEEEAATAPRPRARLRDALADVAARDWLSRQGEANGFTLTAVQVDSYTVEDVPRQRERPVRFGVLDVQGLLDITDPAAFLTRLALGIGRARAFGCGLMLIRRA